MGEYMYFVYFLLVLGVRVNAEIERPRGVSISSKLDPTLCGTGFSSNFLQFLFRIFAKVAGEHFQLPFPEKISLIYKHYM